MISPRQRRTREQRPHTEANGGERLLQGTGALGERGAARYHALPSGGPVGDAYERFLRMPVAAVLAVLWFAGVALLSSFIVVLYVLGASLVSVAGGA